MNSMEFNRVNDVNEKRKKEQMEADSEKMKADIDYIAMMADIDLSEGDENGGVE